MNPTALLHYATQAHQTTLKNTLHHYATQAHQHLLQDILTRHHTLSTHFDPQSPWGPAVSPWTTTQNPLQPQNHRELLAWMLQPTLSNTLAHTFWRQILQKPHWNGHLTTKNQQQTPLDLLAWDPTQKSGLAIAMTTSQDATTPLSASLDAMVEHTLHHLGEDTLHNLTWLYLTPNGEPPTTAWNTRHLWTPLSWGAWRQHIKTLSEQASLPPTLRLWCTQYQHLLTRWILTDPHSFQKAREAWRNLKPMLQNLETHPLEQLQSLHKELCILQRTFHPGPR